MLNGRNIKWYLNVCINDKMKLLLRLFVHLHLKKTDLYIFFEIINFNLLDEMMATWIWQGASKQEKNGKSTVNRFIVLIWLIIVSKLRILVLYDSLGWMQNVWNLRRSMKITISLLFDRLDWIKAFIWAQAKISSLHTSFVIKSFHSKLKWKDV